MMRLQRIKAGLALLWNSETPPDPLIKLRWMKLCGRAFDRANLANRAAVGSTLKTFPLDRVDFNQLLRELDGSL